MQYKRGNRGIRTEISNIKTEVQTEFIRLENKLEERHKILYGVYKQNIKGIAELRKDIHNLMKKVENHEINL